MASTARDSCLQHYRVMTNSFKAKARHAAFRELKHHVHGDAAIEPHQPDAEIAPEEFRNRFVFFLDQWIQLREFEPRSLRRFVETDGVFQFLAGLLGV